MGGKSDPKYPPVNPPPKPVERKVEDPNVLEKAKLASMLFGPLTEKGGKNNGKR